MVLTITPSPEPADYWSPGYIVSQLQKFFRGILLFLKMTCYQNLTHFL